MSNPKKPIMTAHVIRKSFSYEKDGTMLAFQLRTDIKTELSNFAELLEMASREVAQELAKR